MRFVPTRVRAAMDYVVGLLLIAGPWIFQFADESRPATWVSVLVGVAILGASAVTAYEGGVLAHVIAMPMHLAMDAVLGVFLIVSPWLFVFADNGINAWLPFVLIGVGELGLAATTRTTSDTRAVRGRWPHGAH